MSAIRKNADLLEFPKKTVSAKDDGYTPLPNFVIDEGYLAVLDGEAIKCLIFLNRHVRGFHLEKKSMSEKLVKKLTGIKDGRTVQKYMAELAKYQLIKIDKSRGKSNVYSLSFDERLPTQDVGTKAPTQHVGTQEAPTQHVGTPPTQDVGTTTDMPCRSVKEIDLKENIKNKKSEFSKIFSDEDLFATEFLPEHNQVCSLEWLYKNYDGLVDDFFIQAQKINPEVSIEQLQTEFKGFAQWSLGRSDCIPQAWMNYWTNRIQNIKPSQAQAKSGKNKERGLSEQQIVTFGFKLSNHPAFASNHAPVGWTQDRFTAWVTEKLAEPRYQTNWAVYLQQVGFTGGLVS